MEDSSCIETGKVVVVVLVITKKNISKDLNIHRNKGNVGHMKRDDKINCST